MFCDQFGFQPITVCNEHALEFLDLEDHCLYLRSVETFSLKRRDNLVLLSNKTFAFRDAGGTELPIRSAHHRSCPCKCRGLDHTQ
jgi:hypothetical protein